MRFGWVRCVALAAFMLPARADAQETAPLDLTRLPFEQLLDMEVVTASTIARQVSSAPSAVSIVTADDIRSYGYRTLGQVLESMRGLWVTNDRAYSYLSGRGYGRPGDFTGRIMLTIDGTQVNDNVYDSAFFDTAALLDTALIDRVEYVSGSGSAVYGNNAFLGIVNVVTKRGREFDGLQVAGEAASYQSRAARMTYGKRFDNGAEVLVSGSGSGSAGQTLYFPGAVGSGSDGVAHHLDDQQNRRLFGKLDWENWAAEAAYVTRTKDIPTAPYGADFNAPFSYQDSTFNASLKHHRNLGEQLKLSLRGYYGNYRYHGEMTFSGTHWNEKSLGQWWGVDAQFIGTWFSGHKLVFGTEYRDDIQQDVMTPVSTSRHDEQTLSLYVQDEVALTTQLTMNLGLRYDYNTDVAGNFSPRAALIYAPDEQTVFKLSHSQSYRTPAPFEKYYTDGALLTNPDLKPERIRALELVAERHFGRDTRLLGSVYRYQTQDFISSVILDPVSDTSQFQNVEGGESTGAELEFERHWQNGIRMRASYAYQDARDGNDRWQSNSPRQIGKFSVSTPLINHLWRAGLEMQGYSNRKTEQGTQVGGYGVANLTLSSDALLPHVDVAFGIRNLFDRDYVHLAPSANTYQTVIPQDGRNFWVQISYDLR